MGAVSIGKGSEFLGWLERLVASDSGNNVHGVTPWEETVDGLKYVKYIDAKDEVDEFTDSFYKNYAGDRDMVLFVGLYDAEVMVRDGHAGMSIAGSFSMIKVASDKKSKSILAAREVAAEALMRIFGLIRLTEEESSATLGLTRWEFRRDDSRLTPTREISNVNGYGHYCGWELWIEVGDRVYP